jgi:hypothetical protein
MFKNLLHFCFISNALAIFPLIISGGSSFNVVRKVKLKKEDGSDRAINKDMFKKEKKYSILAPYYSGQSRIDNDSKLSEITPFAILYDIMNEKLETPFERWALNFVGGVCFEGVAFGVKTAINKGSFGDKNHFTASYKERECWMYGGMHKAYSWKILSERLRLLALGAVQLFKKDREYVILKNDFYSDSVQTVITSFEIEKIDGLKISTLAAVGVGFLSFIVHPSIYASSYGGDATVSTGSTKYLPYTYKGFKFPSLFWYAGNPKTSGLSMQLDTGYSRGQFFVPIGIETLVSPDMFQQFDVSFSPRYWIFKRGHKGLYCELNGLASCAFDTPYNREILSSDKDMSWGFRYGAELAYHSADMSKNKTIGFMVKAGVKDYIGKSIESERMYRKHAERTTTLYISLGLIFFPTSMTGELQ